MNRVLVWMMFLILIISCEGKYPGFSKTKSGIYYKLHFIGEEIKYARPTDYITVDLVYKTVRDSVFLYGRRTLQLTEPEYPGSIDECFMMLSPGDSASFIIKADSFFIKTLKTNIPSFIRPEEPLKVDMKMIDIRTEQQYTSDKEEFLKWIEDFGEYEKMVLKRYINQQKIDIVPTGSGMFFIKTRKGNGKKVEKGDLVTIDYEGKFLNGKYFDSTKKRNMPFEFIFGSEWQVIKGLEEAIGYMEESEKSIVILPSGLAWGEQGSSTGIVPPFTSLIFELEIIKVEKRDSVFHKPTT